MGIHKERKIEYDILYEGSSHREHIVYQEGNLAQILTEEQLCGEISGGALIENGHLDCAEGIKYDFRLGSKILKSSYGLPIDANALSPIEASNLVVEPGEVVFVLTEERLTLPDDIMITLSPKRKLSHEGVQVLGGLCVDPLYRGHLLVGLQNFSSEPFRLIPGRKLIAGVFQRLSKNEQMAFQAPTTEINDFPDELVKLIKTYQPVGAADLQNKVQKLAEELSLVRSVIDDDKQWRADFKNDLDKHNEQIGNLLKVLEKETSNREAAVDGLKTRVSANELKVSTFISNGRLVGGLLLLVVGAVIAELISYWFQ